MDTLKSLNQEKNVLLEKKQVALTALWSISKKLEPRLFRKLLEDIHGWYQSDINMLEWKFDYIEQAMCGPTPHAPDKSGDSVAQAEPAKSSNPPVESAPL